MATNPPSGDGHRNGAVRKRSQVFNPKYYWCDFYRTSSICK